MFAKWFDEYQKLFHETQFLSQLPTFLISIFAVLSLGSIINAVSCNPAYLEHNWSKFLISIIFHSLVFFVFAVRFVLLFFNSKKSFLISQLFWLICIVTLFAYVCVTKESIYGFFYTPQKAEVSFGLHHHPEMFVNASDNFTILALYYFFFSPIRQFITLIISLIKCRKIEYESNNFSNL
jgi:ABC-type multidrug transport system fused ATPase/permease subunit